MLLHQSKIVTLTCIYIIFHRKMFCDMLKKITIQSKLCSQMVFLFGVQLLVKPMPPNLHIHVQLNKLLFVSAMAFYYSWC